MSTGNQEEEGPGFSKEFPELVQVREEETVKVASQAPSRVLMWQAAQRSDEAPAFHVVGLQPSQAQGECNFLKTTQGSGTPHLPTWFEIDLSKPFLEMGVCGSVLRGWLSMKPASNSSSAIPTPVSSLRGKRWRCVQSSGQRPRPFLGQDWERVRDSPISQSLKFVLPPS